jgi:LacI family transcriptional regulator
VDRVLNNRPGVRGRTRGIVLDTAQRLGYIEDHKAAPAGIDVPVRLLFVLPKGTNAYIANLQSQIGLQASHRPDLDVVIQAIEGFNPESLAKTLRELDPGIRGVGIIALDHPSVRAAIQLIEARGVKIVTLASDINVAARTAYVGIDNRAAGRLAGYVMGRFMGAGDSRKVAMFAGSLSYRGHEEREMGFRHVLAEDFPLLKIVELREMGDDRERAYREATLLLDQYEDLSGIYNIGAGNQGIARALREHGKAGKVTFIGHDATEGNKALLIDGTMDALIDQNPRVQAREALNILCAALRHQPYQIHQPRLQIIFRENIPEE